jgi:tetratricopeptide (TPR) repeat protein
MARLLEIRSCFSRGFAAGLACAVAIALAPAAYAGHGGGGGGGHGGGGWGGGYGGGWGGHSYGGSYGGSYGHSYATSHASTFSGHSGSYAGGHYGPSGHYHGEFSHFEHPWHYWGPGHWHSWWNFGFYWPGFGFAWWPWYGFGWWPGYYAYYDFYGLYPCYSPCYMDYAYTAPPAATYTAAYPPPAASAEDPNAANPPPGDAGPPPPPSPDVSAPPAAGQQQSEYYTAALAAFAEADYPNATRLAGHAAVDEPRNPKVHVMLMLGMFAMHEYRGAAMEAHAVTALGPIPDWPTLFAIYGKVEPYTEQLRALEKFTQKNPEAAEARFLLGFQYLMAGHPESAKGEFLKALTLTPKDWIAAKLLKKSGGTIPPEIAKQLPPEPQPQKTAPQGPPPPPEPDVPPGTK